MVSSYKVRRHLKNLQKVKKSNGNKSNVYFLFLNTYSSNTLRSYPMTKPTRQYQADVQRSWPAAPPTSGTPQSGTKVILSFLRMEWIVACEYWTHRKLHRLRVRNLSVFFSVGYLTYLNNLSLSDRSRNFAKVTDLQCSGSRFNQDMGPWGQKLPTKIGKRNFLIWIVLFWWLKASPVAWTSFIVLGTSKLQFLIKNNIEFFLSS